MKVSEYRMLIDGANYWLRSVDSARTPAEREREAGSVRRAAAELAAAVCPRRTAADADNATRALARVAAMEAALAAPVVAVVPDPAAADVLARCLARCRSLPRM